MQTITEWIKDKVFGISEAEDEEVDLYEDDPWDNFADDWETHA